MSVRNSHRIERDSLGEVRIPAGALYGPQTQRAVDNFPLSGLTMPRTFLRALGLVKAAAARANAALAQLEPVLAETIATAALEVAGGRHDGEFPVDVFQTGSGTSTNMNANEVIATLASQRLGTAVHPNDHVNCSQSSNDVIPTALHVSARLELGETLLPALKALADAIHTRAVELADTVKTGRTHLMDALPLTLGQELGGWQAQITDNISRLETALPRLERIALGATAIGTGVNAPPGFAARASRELRRLTAIDFRTSDNLFAAVSCQDTAVELSGQLRVVATSLLKLTGDLRWMNSGPQAGLAELSLPALQPGSSIMPGKVNPVIPESVAMACAQVLGLDTTIAVAGRSGNFQLNTMLPVIACDLLQGITLLARGARLLGDKAIAGFTVDPARLAAALAGNPVLVTALTNTLGYDTCAEIVQRAHREGRTIREVAAELSGLSGSVLDRLLDPARLTRPHDD